MLPGVGRRGADDGPVRPGSAPCGSPPGPPTRRAGRGSGTRGYRIPSQRRRARAHPGRRLGRPVCGCAVGALGCVRRVVARAPGQLPAAEKSLGRFQAFDLLLPSPTAAYPVPSGLADVSAPDDRVKHLGVSGPHNPSIVAWEDVEVRPDRRRTSDVMPRRPPTSWLRSGPPPMAPARQSGSARRTEAPSCVGEDLAPIQDSYSIAPALTRIRTSAPSATRYTTKTVVEWLVRYRRRKAIEA
jgi:hypothetical protein